MHASFFKPPQLFLYRACSQFFDTNGGLWFINTWDGQIGRSGRVGKGNRLSGSASPSCKALEPVSHHLSTPLAMTHGTTSDTEQHQPTTDIMKKSTGE